MLETGKQLENKPEEDLNLKAGSFFKPPDLEKRLFESEILINKEYSTALFEAGVLNRKDSERIINGLNSLLKRSQFDKDYFINEEFENISNFIEEKLIQLTGEVGKKISIGRSDGDFNSTVLRFWLRNEIIKISKGIRNLQKKFLSLAEKSPDLSFLIFTFDNKKIPILFPHWCLAYFEMFSEDRERLDEIWRRTNIMALGADLGNGSSIELDREKLANRLGFEGITTNSLTSVSDRGFVLDFVNSASLIMLHIQQLNSDLIFYSRENIRFVFFNDHSIKNILFKIKSRGDKIAGFQTQLNTNLKGLRLGYHLDFIEQNKIVFETVDLLTGILETYRFVLGELQLNNQKIKKLFQDDFIFESEIFGYFIQRGFSFEQARSLTPRIITLLEEKNKFEEISLNELKRISPLIEEDIFQSINLEKIINQKDLIGGTSPVRVKEALHEAKNTLQFEE
jgi:argininosuccinate lyase